ncbi:MAG: YdcF family protein [Oscillospiraceae bacterium]
MSRYSGRRRHYFLWALGLFFALGLACFAALEGLVFFGGQTSFTGNEQVMVVLGAQVTPTGPAVLLQDRLDAALSHFASHPEMTVVVSGGQGDNEHATEASVMKDYLVARGMPEGSILEEGESHNTAQNLRFTADLLRQQGVSTHGGVLIVTNRFHLFRAKMLGERYGMTVSTLAAPESHPGARLKSYLREPFGIIKSFLFD